MTSLPSSQRPPRRSTPSPNTPTEAGTESGALPKEGLYRKQGGAGQRVDSRTGGPANVVGGRRVTTPDETARHSDGRTRAGSKWQHTACADRHHRHRTGLGSGFLRYVAPRRGTRRETGGESEHRVVDRLGRRGSC